VEAEIIYGIHPVTEALKAGRRDIFEIYISLGKLSRRIEAVRQLAESKKIPLQFVPASRLAGMAQTDTHQGVGARTGAFPFASMQELVAGPGPVDQKLLLILDHLVDPRNLGALIRTAICVGVNGIIIPKDRSALPSPLVSKVSSGALEHALVAKVTNLVHTIQRLKKMDIWIAGMDKDADQSIYAGDFSSAHAIIIGGEEKGLRPLVKKQCDYLISIPQAQKVSSLNASVAGGIIMYEIFRQRSQRP
jgi:23S rRNA (guanosine2251-2'-O)-methyltransferase